jgi:hypothetical protein
MAQQIKLWAMATPKIKAVKISSQRFILLECLEDSGKFKK